MVHCNKMPALGPSPDVFLFQFLRAHYCIEELAQVGEINESFKL